MDESESSRESCTCRDPMALEEGSDEALDRGRTGP